MRMHLPDHLLGAPNPWLPDDSGDAGTGGGGGNAGAGGTSTGSGDAGGAGTGTDDKSKSGTGSSSTDDDDGFPKNTPVDQMTPAQREAYWKAQARKHEGRVKALGNLTPETLAKLQADAGELEKLRKASQTDSEKAVEDALERGRQEGRQALAPELVKNAIAAKVAGRIPDTQLDAVVSNLDHSKFLKDDGTVDADKVKTLVDGLAPAASDGKNGRMPNLGQGSREGGAAGSSVDAGRQAWRDKHPTKTTH